MALRTPSLRAGAALAICLPAAQPRAVEEPHVDLDRLLGMPAASSAYDCPVFHEQSARYNIHDESPEGPMGARRSFTEYIAKKKTEG